MPDKQLSQTCFVWIGSTSAAQQTWTGGNPDELIASPSIEVFSAAVKSKGPDQSSVTSQL